MATLQDLFSALQIAPEAERAGAEHRLIETLTFSSAREIIDFLDAMYAQDFTAMPVWLRNLAFRLACLQQPDDPVLLRKAAADLECFGPDWDDIAARLRERARVFEERA